MSRRRQLSHQPTWSNPYKFVAAFDVHWGYEVVEGKKRPTHNLAAINAMLDFTRDFAPHGFLFGGDQLDFGAISPHTKLNKVATENLRIQQDLDEFSAQVMAPVEEMGISDLWMMQGNHEEWLNRLTAEQSGLADTLTIPRLLNLEERGWHYTPQGGYVDIGKLRFVHGDQLSGGEHIAKAAIMQHHKSIAFGHFHTTQTFTTHSPVDSKDIHIGIAVPTLANRGPAYGRNRTNKWANGFLFGVVYPDQSFNHYIPIMTEGRFWANGRTYGR